MCLFDEKVLFLLNGMSFSYVDEAQDNLLIDALCMYLTLLFCVSESYISLVLRLICRNPEGLFWAGDSAQAISAGSSFRFDDLKAFLYRIEVRACSLAGAAETYCVTIISQQDQSMHLIQDRSVTDPTAFQLVDNYRSHGGIVNSAHTVIERITRFWPDAIDALQPEHGIVEGSKPVFFRDCDQGTARYKHFILGKSYVDDISRLVHS